MAFQVVVDGEAILVLCIVMCGDALVVSPPKKRLHEKEVQRIARPEISQGLQ